MLWRMSGRKIRLTSEGFRRRAALDTAVSRALLRQVSDGAEPETLRLYTPADVVAFGPLDTRSHGYGAAVAAARNGGFEAIERLAGGRAAVFHSKTIAFSWTMPAHSPRADVMERFEETADIMAGALRRLGVDARIGAVEGEYCPGQHSVNAHGERKIMGVGQRLIRSAAHIGGVVVVADSGRIRDILDPVYAALGIAWRPSATGSIEDELGGADYAAAMQAIRAEFAARYELYDGALSPETLRLAKTLEAQHLAPANADAPTSCASAPLR